MIRSARHLLLAAVLLFSAGVARADLDQIRAAAEAGDANAQLELGILFNYGFNYKDNEIPALTWYMLSANQGNARAAGLRDKLMSKMSQQEIEEAIQQVTQFRPSGPAPAKPKAEPSPQAAAPVSPGAEPPAAEPVPAEAPAAESAPAEPPAAQ